MAKDQHVSKALSGGLDLTNLDLEGADLRKKDFSRASFKGSSLSYAQLDRSVFKGSVLNGVSLKEASCVDSDFSNAILIGADLTEAILWADFPSANLTSATLTKAKLRGANLKGCYLTDATLTDADLSGANLSGADLRGANLKGSTLKGANFTGVVFDKHTLKSLSLKQLQGARGVGDILRFFEMDRKNMIERSSRVQELYRRVQKAESDDELESLAEEVALLETQPLFIKEHRHTLRDMHLMIEDKYSSLGKGLRYLQKFFNRGKKAGQIRVASQILLELEREIESYKKVADLSPPLGDPGGLRHTERRIEKVVRNKGLERELKESLIEDGQLTNQEARIVYRFKDCNPVKETKKIKGFCVSSHGQFRMDQRGIKVKDVHNFFFNLERYLERNKTNIRARSFLRSLESGDAVKWGDPYSKLTVVFVLEGDSARVVTAYF
jgi:uncharacterized protein YjbI with pentapeptide repeats